MNDNKDIIKRPETNKTFEMIQSEIKEQLSNREYSHEFLIREFGKHDILRLTYLALVCSNPARVHDIYIEGSFADKKQIYRALYRLSVYGLVKQVPVKSITSKKSKKTEEEKAVLKHFKNWTSKMHLTMQQHFESKTNYWVLTEKGRNPNLANGTLRLEQGAQNE